MKHIKNLKWTLNIVFCTGNPFSSLSLYFKFSLVVLGKTCYRYVPAMFHVILHEHDLCSSTTISLHWADLTIGFIVPLKKKIIQIQHFKTILLLCGIDSNLYPCEHKWKTIIFYKAALSHLKRTHSTSMYSKTMSLLIFVLFLKSSIILLFKTFTWILNKKYYH